MSSAFDHRSKVLHKQPLAGACPFKLRPYDEWRFSPTAASPRLMLGPRRGDPSGPHAFVRCPECNRRLRLAARYCSGGEEFSHWEIPDHRPRESRPKTPKRQSAMQGRGK